MGFGFGFSAAFGGVVAAEEDGGYSTEAEALFARMSSPPDASRKSLIDALIVALVSSGVWDKLDALYVLAAADSQAAALNWKADQFNLIANNDPVFEVDRGFTGGTDEYFSTGFNPSTAGGLYTQNSAHLGAWSRLEADSLGYPIGAGVSYSTRNSAVAANYEGGFAVFSINQVASDDVVNTDGRGHVVVNRSASNATQGYLNSVELHSGATASDGLTEYEFYVLCVNYQDAPTEFFDGQVAAAHFGSSLTAQNVTDLYAALDTYMTAVGAA